MDKVINSSNNEKMSEYCKTCICKSCEQVAWLEQENERLKEENYQLQKDCQICENFIDFIPCKPIRDMDYDLQKVINQRDNYIQALQEIREELEEDITCESRECGCDDYGECLNCLKETILTKINEVIGAEK